MGLTEAEKLPLVMYVLRMSWPLHFRTSFPMVHHGSGNTAGTLLAKTHTLPWWWVLFSSVGELQILVKCIRFLVLKIESTQEAEAVGSL